MDNFIVRCIQSQNNTMWILSTDSKVKRVKQTDSMEMS